MPREKVWGVVQLQDSDRWLAIEATAQPKAAEAADTEIRFSCKTPTGHQLMALQLPASQVFHDPAAQPKRFREAAMSGQKQLDKLELEEGWHLLPGTWLGLKLQDQRPTVRAPQLSG